MRLQNIHRAISSSEKLENNIKLSKYYQASTNRNFTSTYGAIDSLSYSRIFHKLRADSREETTILRNEIQSLLTQKHESNLI